MNEAATVWLNGRFLPMEEARISPIDRGFLYGDGFFETIRVERSRILWLPLHLERLEASLREFRIGLDPTPAWVPIVRRLIEENGLAEKIAAVKIVVTRGISRSLGLPKAVKPTVCITAFPYEPPARGLYEGGCMLHIYRQGFAPALAGMKSLNYLYCLSARQAAFDAGCDMAVLLDREGCVTETCTGSLLVNTDGRWWTPESRFQLPGTTVRSLCALMEKAGITIATLRMQPEELYSANTVWVLNSMIGIMPVAKIDSTPVPDPASAEAAFWRRRLVSL